MLLIVQHRWFFSLYFPNEVLLLLLLKCSVIWQQ